jgi:hypothetical protein
MPEKIVVMNLLGRKVTSRTNNSGIKFFTHRSSLFNLKIEPIRILAVSYWLANIPFCFFFSHFILEKSRFLKYHKQKIISIVFRKKENRN